MNLSNYFINHSLEFRLLVALASLAIAAAVIASVRRQRLHRHRQTDGRTRLMQPTPATGPVDSGQFDRQFPHTFDTALQHVAPHHGRYPGRGTGENQVTRRQGHVTR